MVSVPFGFLKRRPCRLLQPLSDGTLLVVSGRFGRPAAVERLAAEEAATRCAGGRPYLVATAPPALRLSEDKLPPTNRWVRRRLVAGYLRAHGQGKPFVAARIGGLGRSQSGGSGSAEKGRRLLLVSTATGGWPAALPPDAADHARLVGLAAPLLDAGSLAGRLLGESIDSGWTLIVAAGVNGLAQVALKDGLPTSVRVVPAPDSPWALEHEVDAWHAYLARHGCGREGALRVLTLGLGDAAKTMALRLAGKGSCRGLSPQRAAEELGWPWAPFRECSEEEAVDGVLGAWSLLGAPAPWRLRVPDPDAEAHRRRVIGGAVMAGTVAASILVAFGLEREIGRLEEEQIRLRGVLAGMGDLRAGVERDEAALPAAPDVLRAVVALNDDRRSDIDITDVLWRIDGALGPEVRLRSFALLEDGGRPVLSLTLEPETDVAALAAVLAETLPGYVLEPEDPGGEKPLSGSVAPDGSRARQADPGGGRPVVVRLIRREGV